MELDFDKEIDALLRRMPKSDADISADNSLAGAHLDADEISAFAENALPEKAKQRLTAHFADCDSCRKNLSELILLNGENEVETVEEEKATVIAPVIPWYRKLFAFPNLAYMMGALVLAFTGLTAFIALQNFSGMNSEVARSSNANSINPASMPNQSEIFTANANTSGVMNNSAPDSDMAANTTVIAPQRSPEIFNTNSSDDKADDRKQMPTTDSTPAILSRDENDLDSAVSREETPPADIVTSTQPQPEIKRQSPIVAESQPPPKPASVPEARRTAKKPAKNEILSERSGSDKAKGDISDKENAQGASLSSGRQIGGKTFNRRDGVWYDSAYRNQPTTNVRRGTNEYRKLDSGLRSIGNQLGGVVVVVWKTKAYRIQ